MSLARRQLITTTFVLISKTKAPPSTKPCTAVNVSLATSSMRARRLVASILANDGIDVAAPSYDRNVMLES